MIEIFPVLTASISYAKCEQGRMKDGKCKMTSCNTTVQGPKLKGLRDILRSIYSTTLMLLATIRHQGC